VLRDFKVLGEQKEAVLELDPLPFDGDLLKTEPDPKKIDTHL
jgi:hypothetical protein